jgi:16S rRNA (guanine527-N7)-methyltransferase
MHAPEDNATSFSTEVQSALCLWIARVESWNARMDLTAARTREELVDLMLADAVALSSRIPTGSRVIDVGTGAGAPGLALSILRPDLRATLVEPLAKRASFLTTVAGLLGRRDISIERVRGERLIGRGVWDVAISRATMAPAAWIDLGAALTGITPSVWVLLGSGEGPAHATLRPAERLVYAWPLTGAPRTAVRYERA